MDASKIRKQARLVFVWFASWHGRTHKASPDCVRCLHGYATAFVAAQTQYMPHVATAVPCRSSVRPCKTWQQQFLSDFAELRQVQCPPPPPPPPSPP